MQQRRDALTTDDLAAASERSPDEERSEHAGGAQPSRGQEPSEAEATAEPLLPAEDTERYRSRWEDIQAGFVDEPRRSVEAADGLVAEVMKRLAETFSDERSSLEGQWDRGDEVNTEDLRVALQRYRSFFHRLLTM